MKNLLLISCVLLAMCTPKTKHVDSINDYGKVVAYKGKIDNHYYLKYTDSSVTEVKFKYYLMFRKSDTINLKTGLEPK